MAPPSESFPITKVAVLVLLLLVSSLFVSASFDDSDQIQLPQIPDTRIYLGRRTLKDDDVDVDESLALSKKKMKKSSASNDEDGEDEQASSLKKKKMMKLENDAKLVKLKSSSSKNQTKLVKPIGGLASSKNKTKIIKTTSKDVANNNNNNNNNSPNLTKIKQKKLNTTSAKSAKPSNSSAKSNSKSTTTTATTATADKKQKAPPSPEIWMYESGTDGVSDDLVSEFRDLPTKFQQSFIPDLHRISTTSQNYLTKANKEMTRNVKPYVGNRLAPSVTTAISVGIIILPLLILSLIFTKVKAYFSLQRLIIFTQIYLSIYFSTLCLSSLLTGLEPLRFFYATSQSTYVWIQVFQTLGYVIYLSMMLMYLLLVFSTETSLGQKGLGLAQTFVGFAVGLHYYVTVFHRVVLRQPPRTNWKVHGIYATCFLVICLFARAERRKKAYPFEEGEEGKKS